jgi:hypothetical protein
MDWSAVKLVNAACRPQHVAMRCQTLPVCGILVPENKNFKPAAFAIADTRR